MSQKTLERLEYLRKQNISPRKTVRKKQGNLESLVHGKRACQVREGAVGKGLSYQHLAGRLLHIIW